MRRVEVVIGPNEQRRLDCLPRAKPAVTPIANGRLAPASMVRSIFFGRSVLTD